MATCGSLQHIFDKPLPENPTLLESLSSWNQIKPVKPMEQSSLTEIFGELHFKENPQSSSSSSLATSSFFDLNSAAGTTRLDKNDNLDVKKSQSILDTVSSATLKNHQYTGCQKDGDNFSRMNYGSLQLCTEGLGSESSDDVEDMKSDTNEDWLCREEKARLSRHAEWEDLSRPGSGGRAFPPPISSIGRSGKPRVIFKSYRQDGRFVLKEVKMPTLEFLHASREDGRLTLQFVHPMTGETIDEGDEEEVDQEDYEDDSQEEFREEIGNDDDDG